LPAVIQADILQVPTVEKPLYKRTLADVKFQMAEQDNLVDGDADRDVVNMLDFSGNSDLIKGVYEGGFKTWECSIDMVQYLSSLPQEQINNKKVLEVKRSKFWISRIWICILTSNYK
jgi:protein-histidine N-methyltransferase